MEETTTAPLLPPAVEARPSCASAVGRFAVERWFESKTHTSTFSASPAKVKKAKKKHTYTQTNTFISFLGCDRCLLEWCKHTITSKGFCFVQKPEMMVGFVDSSYPTCCI